MPTRSISSKYWVVRQKNFTIQNTVSEPWFRTKDKVRGVYRNKIWKYVFLGNWLWQFNIINLLLSMLLLVRRAGAMPSELFSHFYLVYFIIFIHFSQLLPQSFVFLLFQRSQIRSSKDFPDVFWIVTISQLVTLA